MTSKPEKTETEMQNPQLVAFASQSLVFDRHMRPIRVGDRVRVKRVTGRYGQTRTEEGIVDKQTDQLGTGHVCLSAMIRYLPETGGVEWAGVEWDSPRQLAICYDKHDDFEHGHEKWVEVLPAKG